MTLPTGDDRSTRSHWQRHLSPPLALTLVVAIAAAIALRYIMWLSPEPRFQDLAVYRSGAGAILQGITPYAERASGHGDLVFTYPPFAGLVFAPLVPLALPLGVALVTALSAVGYCCLVLITSRALNWPTRALVLSAFLGLGLEPILRTVQQGQVNLILAAMVIVDAFVMPRRWRGVLVGLAAGVKIVPGAFVFYFLAVGEKKAALRAALTTCVTIVVTWSVAPSASREYWFHLFLGTSRSGGGGYPDNQSLVGVVARLLHNDHPAVWITLPIQAAVLTLAVQRSSVLWRRRCDRLGALLAVAIGALLASPVSWSHHWVWTVPLLMHLASQQRYIAACVGYAVFFVAPMTLSPLGVLGGAPRVVWLATTMLIPVFGSWWLIWGERDSRVSGGESRRARVEAAEALSHEESH